MKAFWMGYIRAEVPDLVHLNTVLPAGLFALYLKFFLGKPFILSEHWTGFQPFRFRQLNLMTHILVRLILQNCRLVLPVSADLGKQMKAVCSKPEFEVVPNVVDTDRFRIFSERKSSAKPRFCICRCSMNNIKISVVSCVQLSAWWIRVFPLSCI
ncbi:MAG: glycosyltransferase [Candidatus Parvibacillus calidus]|nr:MAG: glycosyltransferase [Candidatus Parvibacillus calidus]